MDRDSDGKLNQSEVSASGLFSNENLRVLLGVQDLGAWTLSRGDADGNGTLSEAEYAALVPAAKAYRLAPGGGLIPVESKLSNGFETVDANKDGQIAADELTAQTDNAWLARFASRTAAPKSFGSSPDGLLLLNDTDSSGALSKEELAVAAAAAKLPEPIDSQALLSAVDTDGDGEASDSELRATGERLIDLMKGNGRGVQPSAEDVALVQLFRSTVDRLVGRLVPKDALDKMA